MGKLQSFSHCKWWENCKVICISGSAWSRTRAELCCSGTGFSTRVSMTTPTRGWQSCLSGPHIIFIHYLLLWSLERVLIGFNNTHYSIWEKITVYLGDLDQNAWWETVICSNVGKTAKLLVVAVMLEAESELTMLFWNWFLNQCFHDYSHSRLTNLVWVVYTLFLFITSYYNDLDECLLMYM